jgi:hypothetical protein
LIPEDRDAELEAAHRRARVVMEEVNRLARPARIRAGLEQRELRVADWALVGIAVVAAASFTVWLWRSGKNEHAGSGLDVLGVG